MKDFLARLGLWLRRAVTATVGHFSWQPPGWLRALASTLRAPRAGFALLGLVALAASGGFYAFTHRKLPPLPPSPHPPRLVHATIIAPGIPALSDKPVLPTLKLRDRARARRADQPPRQPISARTCCHPPPTA